LLGHPIKIEDHLNHINDKEQSSLWYDGIGRVWQRWNDNSHTSAWDASLTRFVYDGGQLAQEHAVAAANILGAWVYTYSDLTRDYLRHAAGVRQRERSGGSDTDYFMHANQGVIEHKYERAATAEGVARAERSHSADQLSQGTFSNI